MVRLLRVVAGFGAGFCILACLTYLGLSAMHGWINISASLPYGLYQTVATGGVYTRGNLILSCLPDAAAKLAAARGYTAFGACSFNTAPVGKYIAALPGDAVSISAAGVRVNGTLLNASTPALHDAQGRALAPAKLQRRLREHEYLLLNPLPGSFDSRYCGIVRDELFKARLQPLITWH